MPKDYFVFRNINIKINLITCDMERQFDSELGQIAKKLCEPSARNALARNAPARLPATPVLKEIMDRLKAAFFPGYFGNTNLAANSLPVHMAANLDSIHTLLSTQIVAGLCFGCASDSICSECETRGKELARLFMRELPELAEHLAGDAQAAFEGDPAVRSIGEAIFCYPSLRAMCHHRTAHTLYRLNVPLIPRMIAEMAHSVTGIDIHPGAQIGKNFFIDHGTGVVIGETAIVGDNCRIYQGVTLGALSFPKNSDGSLVKGLVRHPILEDGVTVYAGATILGRVTIGKDSIIGGNVWITEDVPPNSVITQNRHMPH